MECWLKSRALFRWLVLMLVVGMVGSGCGSRENTSESLPQEHVADGSSADGASAPEAALDILPEQVSEVPHVPEDAPEKSEPWVPPFAPAVCGMASYQWLPPGTMGQLVLKKQLEVYSLPKEGIEALLKAAKYTQFKVKYGVTVYQFRYETQDRGKKVEATGVMAFPQVSGQEKASFPYVLWLHGTTGFSDSCAPSKRQEGPLSVALLASQGYLAVAPDYIGMIGMGAPSTTSHPYVVGEPTAMASWDSIRAAGQLLRDISAPVQPDNRVVIWGGSQGGHAAMFSLLYAAYYAPEYTVSAVLALIAPLDLPSQVLSALETLDGSTLLLAAIAIAYSRWYGMQDRLPEIITDLAPNHFAKELPKLMESQCSVDAKKFSVKTSADVFTDKFIQAVRAGGNWKGFEHWYCMFAENSLTLTSVKQKGKSPPILFMVSEKDELVDAKAQRNMYEQLCKQGYSMEYLECKGALHAQGAVWSLPEQFQWVVDRLAGKPLQNACQRTPPTCCSGADPKVCSD